MNCLLCVPIERRIEVECSRWTRVFGHGTVEQVETNYSKGNCHVRWNTRWFKYDRDKLWLLYTQIVPVILEPPCIWMHTECADVRCFDCNEHQKLSCADVFRCSVYYTKRQRHVYLKRDSSLGPLLCMVTPQGYCSLWGTGWSVTVCTLWSLNLVVRYGERANAPDVWGPALAVFTDLLELHHILAVRGGGGGGGLYANKSARDRYNENERAQIDKLNRQWGVKVNRRKTRP